MRWILTLALSLGCGGRVTPKGEVTVAVVRSWGEVQANDGHRARVEGIVSRPPLSIGPGAPWRGTGLTLDDGTLIWVDYAKTPPQGWEGLEGQRVVVEGMLWAQAPPDARASQRAPHLTDWSAPAPAGAGGAEARR
jgi:hypothetical protein